MNQIEREQQLDRMVQRQLASRVLESGGKVKVGDSKTVSGVEGLITLTRGKGPRRVNKLK